MARFCTNCGKKISDGDAFCSSCGAKTVLEDTPITDSDEISEHDASALTDGDTVLVDVIDASEECCEEHTSPAPPSMAEAEPQQESQQPFDNTPQPSGSSTHTASPVTPAEDPSCKVAGVGAFLGFEFLFSLPLIGWILCIIMSFAPKNKNLKNFARAKLIWITICTLLFAWVVITLLLLGSMLITYLERDLIPWLAGFNGLPGTLDTLEELIDGLNEVASKFGY